MQKQTIIVSGILEHNGKILLAKRATTKKIAPGKYHLPGGHVEFGENPDTALIREFYEEFRLEITVDSVARAFSYVIGATHTVGISYQIQAVSVPQEVEFDPRETEAIAWANRSSLSEYLSPTDHDYITLQRYFSMH